MSSLYQKAGVDIAKGDAFVKKLERFTEKSATAGASGKIGGFGGIFDLKAIASLKDPLLVSATDGVGTKLLLAKQTKIFDGLGQDLVAMCVNDLIAQGAMPLFFLDYIACGKLEADKLANIVESISDACVASGCSLVGGETAEMPDAYQAGDLDLAGFAVGAVERARLLPNDKAKAGDVILGLASNGVHSNGFSLVRAILKENNLDDEKILRELLTPTRLYVKPLLALLGSDLGAAVYGIAHITGGGLIENPPRSLLNENLEINIDYSSWHLPDIFALLQEQGKVSDEEMRRVFNCGIGITLIVDKQQAEQVQTFLEKQGEKVFTIGVVDEKKKE